MGATAEHEDTVVKPRSAASDGSFTARLRVETRGEHEAIERNRRLRRLTETDLGVEEYVSVLARLAGFLGPVETELHRWAGRFPRSLDLDARLTKADLLGRDLAALAPGFDGRVSALAAPFAGLATFERAWGCLYVFEGATLGGQILARSLHAQLGLTADRGTAFYNAYGKQTGARWKAFKAALNASVVEDGLDPGEIIAGARATFQSMNAWMDADA